MPRERPVHALKRGIKPLDEPSWTGSSWNTIPHVYNHAKCYNVHMEITELERAQIIIDTLKQRVFQLEDDLLGERAAHRTSVAAYNRYVESNSTMAETGEGGTS